MKDIKGLYLNQILVIVFNALTCISVFLPAATIYDKSVNLFMPGGKIGNGIFFIVLSIAVLLLILVRKKILALILAVINVLLGFIQYAQFSDYTEFASIGLYLMLIGTIALLASTIFALKRY